VILVDSNVFVIDLRYPRDPLHGVNRRFLDRLAERGSGATTLVNLLEVAGILSFNLNSQQTRELLAHLPRKYGITVVPELDLDGVLPSTGMRPLVDQIAGRSSFGDALVIEMARVYASDASHFVTWDDGHFFGRTPMRVATPREMLKRWPAP
jgi:predicted nucleic acid-binding protein